MTEVSHRSYRERLVTSEVRRGLWILGVGAALLGGCSDSVQSDGDADSARPPDAWAYEKEFGPGPVTLTLRVDRTKIGLADQVVLEEELWVEDGFEGEFPEYLPEDFEGFTVTDVEQATVVKKGETKPRRRPGEARRKRILLEPERSGSLAVAPLWVYFREEGEKGESHFQTQEVPVEVEGIDDPGALEVSSPAGIIAAPPRSSGPALLLWAAAGVLVLGLGAVGVVLYVVSRRPARLRATPPHEIAWEALRRLAEAELVEKGEVELFYVHLSAVLRQYIENRFRVHAPERTTEEFLEEAATSPSLQGHRGRLGEFLRLSDQVKFARFQPETPSIQASFDTVKLFIQETTPEPSSAGES